MKIFIPVICLLIPLLIAWAIWGVWGVLLAAFPAGLIAGIAQNIVEHICKEKEAERKAAFERQKEAERKRRELQAKIEAERIAKEKAAIEMQRKAEIEKAIKQRREQLAAILAMKEAAFESEMENIPSFAIELSTEPYKKRSVRDMPVVKFTNITKATNPLTFTTYVVVDVETTGIPLTSKIVEISAIRFEGHSPVEKFTTLVNPERTIPAEATSINNITDDMVADAPKIWEVMPSFQKFVGSSTVVGHNLAFDLQFLYAYGFNLDNPKQRFYDTLQLAKSVLVRANYDFDNDYDVEDYKLGTLCDYYGIYFSDAHRSCSDCLATGKLFEKLAKIKMQ